MNKPQSTSANTVALVIISFLVIGALTVAVLGTAGFLLFFGVSREVSGPIPTVKTATIPTTSNALPTTPDCRVYCDATGQATIDGVPVSIEEIQTHVAGLQSVLIEADTECEYKTIQEINEACVKQGVAHVEIAVRAPANEPPSKEPLQAEDE